MVPALRDERERCPVTPARTLALNAELSNYAVKTIQVLQPEKLRSVRKAPDRELRRANHPPAESYGVPAPYPTPLAIHRALQGGMARAARHRDSPTLHGDS